MKRISRAEQTVIDIPVIPEPIEVQVPPVIIPVEIRRIQVAVGVAPDFVQNIVYATTLRILSGLYLIWYLKIP